MSPENAGYSGTPLVRKLGVKPGSRLVVLDAPDRWTVPDLPEDVDVSTNEPAGVGSADVVLVFVRAAAGLDAAVALGSAVYPDGGLWIAWPRRAGGHDSDMTESAVRDAALPLGLVDVKVAALDADWSGVRLVWRREVRGAPDPPTAWTP